MARWSIPDGFSERFRALPRQSVDLAGHDPDGADSIAVDRDAADECVKRLNSELESLQELLWARGKEKVLVVLQGMDTSGKDGVIRKVFDGVNPLGVKVASFKAPTPDELARDFLWRVHARVPAAGELTIFNRSHYEDVLVVRVRSLVAEREWRRRYQQIRDFERLLVETGTTVLKFFLHISKGEQKRRLEERLADPEKLWKFDPRDLEARARWDDYQAAYAEAIERTSTEEAPWYIVPSDRKWFRNLVVASVLVERLRSLGMSVPEPRFDPAALRVD